MKLKDHINIKKFFINIVLPTLLAEVLFIVLIFAVFVPYLENNLIEAKKEMIKEIINSSICIAQKNYSDFKQGKLTENQAKENALITLENIRYGTENKDYLWITDETPIMIMHPYKKELINKNVQDFTDPNGKRMFMEMINKVKESGEGYVDYMWQWMDDSTRIVPKISFIKLFKEWNWIIGTGVYIEDIRNSIKAVINSLILVSLGIFTIISFLLILIVRQNYKVEIKRTQAEKHLKESNEKYKALVEASTDGTIMFINNECLFKNKKISELIDNSVLENIQPDLEALINPSLKNDLTKIKNFLNSDDDTLQLETQIISRNKILTDVLINFSKIEINGNKGLIIIIKDLMLNKNEEVKNIINSEIVTGLSEKLDIGIFRALYDRKSRIIEANNPLLKLLGYDTISELSTLNLFNLFDDSNERKKFLNLLNENGYVKDFVCKIRKKGNVLKNVIVNVVKTESENNIIYLDGTVSDYDLQQKEIIEKEELIKELINKLSIFDLPVSALNLKEIPKIDSDIMFKDVLNLLDFYSSSDIQISSSETQTESSIPKILNSGSISKLILNKEKKEYDNVSKYAEYPKDIIYPETLICEALERMKTSKTDKILVLDNNSYKYLFLNDILELLYSNSKYLEEKLKGIRNLTNLKELQGNLSLYINNLVKAGSDIKIINSLITKVSDIITQKIIEISLIQTGEPPCKFCFIALGSEGRSEQGLATDQDNAIIFEDVPQADELTVKEYFSKLAERINTLLNETGYKLCVGEVMASNPKWNQPLEIWKKYFEKWIKIPEPQALIDSSIFFDFRCIYGEKSLTDELRKFINICIRNNPQFLNQLALLTVNYKLPLGLFGKIQTEAKDEHSTTFNLKNAIRLIVNIVRLYAMKHSINETNTLLRIEALRKNNFISESFYKDIEYCFKYLMQIQFKFQTLEIEKGYSPKNYLDLSMLTEIELANLKNVLGYLSVFQSAVKYDFGINI